MSDYTNKELARKLSALESQLTELRRLVLALPAQIVKAEPKPEGVTVNDDGRMFIPGTGWTGPTSRPVIAPVEDVPVSNLDRYLPKHLRTEQTDDQETA